MNDDFTSEKLPESWIKVPLGEVIQFQYGKPLPSNIRVEGGQFKVFGSGGHVGSHNQALVTEPCIIVGRKGSVGNVFISEQPCWPIDTVYFVIPPAGIDIKYLFYHLIILNFAQLDKSTAIPGLNRDDAYKSIFNLAPQKIQGLIVQKIEELFSHIDAGVVELKQAKTKLQQYRQSVLNDAVTGKLTAHWREHNSDKLEPADRLLENILDERRANWKAEQLQALGEKAQKNMNWVDKYKAPPKANTSSLPEIPNGWVWATITQLGELARGKSKHRPRNDPSLYGGDYPFVQTGDVRAADGLLTTFKQTYSEKGLAQSRLWSKGTLCITIAANIAETAILGINACFPDSIVGFTPQNESVSVEYIELFFRTARENLERFAPATAQKNINLAILEMVSVPFMSIEEQKEIVLQVTERLEAAKRTETTIDEKIKYSASLKSSILVKSFSGKLVRNDGDTSAKELLDQIKAEKEALIDTNPKRVTVRINKMDSERKSLLTVLNEQSSPVSPDELMQLAGFSLYEVEDFYIELAEISEQIEQFFPKKNMVKNWPYHKESNIKLKLKD